MKPSVALALHAAELRALAAARGFADVRVFGSTARGEDSERSDLDILVCLPTSEKFGEAFALVAELGSVLPEVKVDAVVDIMLRPEVREQALLEGRRL
jgi:predicted nucleotidyltransferase